jgi:hypothetical protein
MTANMIRFETDGILVMEVNNPTMRVQMKIKGQDRIRDNNIYDMV